MYICMCVTWCTFYTHGAAFNLEIVLRVESGIT